MNDRVVAAMNTGERSDESQAQPRKIRSNLAALGSSEIEIVPG
jgi:hypothetical protein